MDYDFTWRGKIDKERWERSQFLATTLKAKQILYDISRSVAQPADKVTRYEELVDEWARQRLAVKVALVYLVAKFDNDLNRHFHALWSSRRDILHDWIKRRLSRRKDEDEEEGGSGEPALLVKLKDLWRGHLPHMSLQDYFVAEMHELWNRRSPSQKLSDLRAILKPEVPEEDLEVFGVALRVRNEFVHPKDSSWPTKPTAQPKLREEKLTEQWFGQVCEVFASLHERLAYRVGRETSRCIATNVRNLDGFLTEAQKAAFRGFFQNSGDHYKDLESLMGAVDRQNANTKPELLILEVTDEVVGNLRRISRFIAAQQLPLILLEASFSATVGRKQLKRIEDFAKRRKRVAYVPSRTHYLKVKNRGSVNVKRLTTLATRHPQCPLVISEELVLEKAGEGSLSQIRILAKKHPNIHLRRTREGSKGHIDYRGAEGLQFWIKKFTGK